MAAYLILRAFSWQLRLSPVAFEEFAAALFTPQPTPYMDEVRRACSDSRVQERNYTLGSISLSISSWLFDELELDRKLYLMHLCRLLAR